MSQFGMQLPGSAARRGGSLNVYSILMLVTVLCLATAAALAFVQGRKIAPNGQAWAVHPKGQKVTLMNSGKK